MQTHRKSTRLRSGPARLIAFAAILSCAPAVSGCSSVPKFVTADQLCQAWRHKTIDPKDVLTDSTASQIEGDNKSRPAWGCAYGQNKAKS